MEKILKELEVMKDELVDMEKEKNQIDGRIKEVMLRLKKEFDISSIEEAQKIIVSLQEEKEKEEASILKEYSRVKKIYDKL